MISTEGSYLSSNHKSIHRGIRLLQISLVVKTKLLQTTTKLAETPLPISLCPPPTCTTRQVATTPKVSELFFPSKQKAECSLKLGRDQFVPRLFHFIIRKSRLNGQEIPPAVRVITHCGRVTQICFFNTVNLGTSASSP